MGGPTLALTSALKAVRTSLPGPSDRTDATDGSEPGGTPLCVLRARTSLALEGRPPVTPDDPAVARSLLCCFAQYLDGPVIGPASSAGAIAPIVISWTLGGSPWLKCRVGPGGAVVYEDSLRAAVTQIAGDFAELSAQLVLSPDRVADELVAEPVTVVEARDLGLRTEASTAARSGLKQAFSDTVTERASDLFPGPWSPEAPWYQVRFELAGLPALISVASRDKVALSCGKASPSSVSARRRHLSTGLNWSALSSVRA